MDAMSQLSALIDESVSVIRAELRSEDQEVRSKAARYVLGRFTSELTPSAHARALARPPVQGAGDPRSLVSWAIMALQRNEITIESAEAYLRIAQQMMDVQERTDYNNIMMRAKEMAEQVRRVIDVTPDPLEEIMK